MSLLRAYGFSLLLLLSIAIGLVIGQGAPAWALRLRPLGDLFLNLVFMLIVPLTFFTVSASLGASPSGRRLTKISTVMLLVFLATSVIAAVWGLGFMYVVHPTPGADIVLGRSSAPLPPAPDFLSQLVATCTTSDFPQLVSRKSMLPLLLFAVGVGLAARSVGEPALPFVRVLQGGSAVFIRLFDAVMYVAPIGLLSFFAATVVDTGSQLASAYLRVFWVYGVVSLLYFGVGFSFYAYLAGGWESVRRLWSQMLRPSLTALGTCSSMATMPVNLEAARDMGIPKDVCDVVIPVGAVLHKDGSVIGGVLKVLFALSLFHLPLTPGRLLMVIGIAILVGVVMGAIPSGGMMGELLILSAFGFPPETLPLLAVISILIDPLATLLNATGDNVAAMLTARLVPKEQPD